MSLKDTEIYVDPNWKKIGISLSGGADSALLAYLVLKKSKADIVFITQVRMWKTRPWQSHVAKDVVNWFRTRFDNNINHIEGFIPPEMEEPHTTFIKDEYGNLKSGNRIILRAHNEYICHREQIDAWFAGLNKNPDVMLEGAMDDRNTPSIAEIDYHLGVCVCHPFAYTTKDWIVKQYYEEGIEDLLNLTRSCEGEFDGLNYKTYIPGQFVPTCGKCFWCKEREWAIEQSKK